MLETNMTDDHTETPTTADAWRDRVAYHRDRALQEKHLAERSKTARGRTAHLLLSDRHAQLMTSAEQVVGMADPEMPQSSSLRMTGWLIRQSYGDQP
ncbi:hypothetical protein ASF00_01410 [Sphingomonas sp. Leaf34]|nr:hypothetical protein ASF00_01410 [Sphingomonas sp. Leaf34]